MISCPAVRKSEIRRHYDLATLFYRALWGEHIHHGLWEADESPRQAQRQLIEHLISAAQIPLGAQVLDVGCGMGGSAIYLARALHCHVTGVTLSGLQRRWAQLSAIRQRAWKQTTFLCRDAETVEFPPESFDVVWSIECTEHLFDKPAFFSRAAEWLRPGGRVAICAWLAGENTESAEATELLHEVCESFLCPSFGTAGDYTDWLTSAGLQVESVVDLTAKVARTWEICESRVRRTGVDSLARLLGVKMDRFVKSFGALTRAYREGVMQYGSFVARRPDKRISRSEP